MVRGQRDAALVWIKTLEDAGIDTVGEGEIAALGAGARPMRKEFGGA